MNFISKSSMTRGLPGVWKNHSHGSMRLLVGKRAPFSLEMKFTMKLEADLFVIYKGVFRLPPQAFGFWQVSFFNLEKVKAHGGDVNWYPLTFGNINQTSTSLSGHRAAKGAVKLGRSFKYQTLSQHSEYDDILIKCKCKSNLWKKTIFQAVILSLQLFFPSNWIPILLGNS